MLKSLVPLILIYISLGAYAADNTIDLRSERDMAAITDLMIPDLEDLDCTPKCDGGGQCGNFKEINSCLDNEAQLGCFWSCE